jgi:nucleotide-binding universal stress UspA family protein
MQRFGNILFVSTAGADDRGALERAASLADSNQADLTLVEVVEQLPAGLTLAEIDCSTEELQTDLVDAAGERLEALAAPWRRRIQIHHKVVVGTPFLETIREVLRGGRDLVVKASESDGLLDRVFGSQDMHLLRKCPCPVWLVKPSEFKPYRRILAAVDMDQVDPRAADVQFELSRQIVEMASSLALSELSELHLVNAWEAVGESALRTGRAMLPPSEVEKYVEDVRLGHQRLLDVLSRHLAERLGDRAMEYLKMRQHLIKGAARKVIPDLAAELGVDLVVMGTVGRTGIAGFLIGNTAETILNRLSCSVLAVKPKGFVSPVRLEG